ncbi:MAG: nitroreductase [Gammaproteobacteria bacterium]|nr:nitroreductase [Gammaproteobacteria bacterium]
MTVSIENTIKSRRTIHQFKHTEIPPLELLERAIDSCIWAPNHHLTQPWRFHLIGPQTAELICLLNAELVQSKKGEKAAEIKLRRWREIPGWLLMSRERVDDNLRDQEDYAACCCAAQNLSLLLWEQSIGMKWTTGEITRNGRFFDIVGLNFATESVVGLFWYGYPADIPQATRIAASKHIKSLP